MVLELFKKKESNVALNCQEVIKLSLFDEDGYFYERSYIMAEYDNGVDLLFLNEVSDSPFFDSDKIEEFKLIKTPDDLFHEMENDKFLIDFLDSDFHDPPKYVNFDVLLIHDKFKELFKKHLENYIEGYTESDLYGFQIERINSFYKAIGGDGDLI